MKTKRRNFTQRAVSFALAIVMMISAFCFSMPQEVAAATPSFKGKGKSTVTISDKKAYGTTGKSTWIKFKPSVTGYVTLTMKNNSQSASYGYAEITFCNSKKKALGQSNEVFGTGSYADYIYSAWKSEGYDNMKKANCYTRTYGVKKGTTYYFKVNSDAGVKLTASVTSAKKGSNTSKKNATTLKAGKNATGIVIAGEKTAYWYKINLTKSAKLKISYSAKTNGTVTADNNGIKLTFYKGDNKFTSDSTTYLSPVYSSSWTQLFKASSANSTQFDLDTGTYYVKVERYNKTSSGQYTLKYNTY